MSYLVSIANVTKRAKEGEVLSFEKFQPLTLHSSIEEARAAMEKYYQMFSKKEYPVLLRIDEIGKEYDYIDVKLKKENEDDA